MKENWKKFYKKIEKLSLPELEGLIKELYEELRRSRATKDFRLDGCLRYRKSLINKNFKFTPLAVIHIERVNRILTESTAKVLQRSAHLYRQMVKLKEQGDDDFLDEFNVDGTVAIEFNDKESVLILNEDENNGQSDYVAMAKILENTQIALKELILFTFFYTNNMCYQGVDEELEKAEMLKINWNDKLLSAPELSGIETFCHASYFLFDKLSYSISDIIRINRFCNEVKVTHRNWGVKRYIFI